MNEPSPKMWYIGVILGIIIIVLVIIGIHSAKTKSAEAPAIIPTTTTDTPTPTQPLPDAQTSTTPQKIMDTATIKTNMGDIVIKLDTANAPKTTANFITLANKGFYDGVRFHRVIKDFMIQTGDPLSKDLSKKSMWGTGGPGYQFADELSGNEKYTQGTVAMANAGPNTNGSQFFIVTATPGYPLPPSYTVFGHVTKGLDVAMKIQNVKTDPSNDQPVSDVIMEKVSVQ